MIKMMMIGKESGLEVLFGRAHQSRRKTRSASLKTLERCPLQHLNIQQCQKKRKKHGNRCSRSMLEKNSNAIGADADAAVTINECWDVSPSWNPLGGQ